MQASDENSNGPMRRIRIVVSGRVQGVFFRAATCEQAAALDLTGWVRNLADGSVEVTAEGVDANVMALLRWCAHGPPRARVERVDWSEETPLGEFREFEVRHGA